MPRLILLALAAISILIESTQAVQNRANDEDDSPEGRKRRKNKRKPCKGGGFFRDGQGRTFLDVNLNYLDVDHNFICGDQYPLGLNIGHGGGHFGGGHFGGGNKPHNGHFGGGNHGGSNHGGGGYYGGGGYPGYFGGGYPGFFGGSGGYPGYFGGGGYPGFGGGGYPNYGGGGYPGFGGGGRPPLAAASDPTSSGTSSGSSGSGSPQELGCGFFGLRPCRPSAIRPVGTLSGLNTQNSPGSGSGNFGGSGISPSSINGPNFGAFANTLGNFAGQVGSFFNSGPPLAADSSPSGSTGSNQVGISQFLDALRPSNIQSAFQNSPLGGFFDGSLINQFFGDNTNQNVIQRPPSSSATPAPPSSSGSGDDDKPIHQDYDEVLPDNPSPQSFRPGLPPRTPFKDY